MGVLEQMKEELALFGSGPSLEEMPRRTLRDKGLDGPSAAHRIEELHTPFNYAFLSCTTGSSALPGIVGVTPQELPDRIAAGRLALERAGLRRGDRLLISYPPLVSVFPREALDESGIAFSLIPRPSRDALLAALGTERPRAVLGESRFLRAALVDAGRLGVLDELPRGLIVIAAGSPMDGELAAEAARIPGAVVHDLYGCQEFGWLCLDGLPLRGDITLWDGGGTDARSQLLVGGLPTGDCFLTRTERDGTRRVLTATRLRAETETELTVTASRAADPVTVRRAARGILRCKARIVRVSPSLRCGAPETELLVSGPGGGEPLTLRGPEKTAMFDALLEAQMRYQREARADPVWNKPC